MSTVSKNKLLTLYDKCVRTVSKAMFKCLIKETSLLSYDLLLQFAFRLPQAIVLDVMRTFIFALDHGHTCTCLRMNNINCSYCFSGSTFWGKRSHKPYCQFFKKPNKRQKRQCHVFDLSKHCTYIAIAICTDDTISPSFLMKESFPLTERMRLWLVSFVVDAFLLRNGVISQSTISVNPCNQKPVKLLYEAVASKHCRQKHHRLETLDLTNSRKLSHVTRTAVAVLKQAIKQSSGNKKNQIFGMNKEPKPIIKLGVAMFNFRRDRYWYALLKVLRKCYVNGFRVNLSSVRFFMVCSSEMNKILQKLPNPEAIRKLEFCYYHLSCFFETLDGLSRLVGLEELYFCSCCLGQRQLSLAETCYTFEDLLVRLPIIITVEKDRFRMTFNDNANSNEDDA